MRKMLILFSQLSLELQKLSSEKCFSYKTFLYTTHVRGTIQICFKYFSPIWNFLFSQALKKNENWFIVCIILMQEFSLILVLQHEQCWQTFRELCNSAWVLNWKWKTTERIGTNRDGFCWGRIKKSCNRESFDWGFLVFCLARYQLLLWIFSMALVTVTMQLISIVSFFYNKGVWILKQK